MNIKHILMSAVILTAMHSMRADVGPTDAVFGVGAGAASLGTYYIMQPFGASKETSLVCATLTAAGLSAWLQLAKNNGNAENVLATFGCAAATFVTFTIAKYFHDRNQVHQESIIVNDGRGHVFEIIETDTK